VKYKIIITERAGKIVESLNYRQLLNQVCCPRFSTNEDFRLEDYGSMFFSPTEKNLLIDQINSFKDKCQVPPFIVSDLEYGPGNMILGTTKFSSMMAISQADSAELAYEVGKITAQEAAAIGYNWTFSPVADLAFDKDSPVVSMRSAGHDPDHVVKIIEAYMRGLQENGLIATIKHFPGDGYSSYDQHLTTPENPLDMKTWHKNSGKVFKELINAGAMAVMPGHISLPSWDTKNEELGLYPPATFSKRILIDLLRNELGFEGLVVSDAIEMGGAVGFMNYFDACSKALESGCDCLLFPRMNEHFYREMKLQLEKGNLTVETLKDRACRIISLKEQVGLFNNEPKKNIKVDRTYSKQISDQVVDESITIIRDRKRLIPFNIVKNIRVLHVVIVNNHDRYMDLFDAVKKEIEKYSDMVTQMIDPGPDALFKAIYSKAYDLVICSIGSRLSYGLNVVRLHDEIARNMMGGWTKLGTPIIFVAHFHPFIHKEYEASIDTIINTYGNTDYVPKRLLEGITGSKPMKRKLLVHD
jgi:beta-N-acetylhexosaminidase